MNPTTIYTIKKDGEDIDFYFGNNTLQKYLEINKIEDINKLEETISKNPLKFLPDLMFSAHYVYCKKNTKDCKHDFEFFSFLVDDLESDVTKAIVKMFNDSVYRLGKMMGGQAPKKAIKTK